MYHSNEIDVIDKDEKKKIVNEQITIDENALIENGFVSVKPSLQRSNVNAEFRAIKHEIISNVTTADENEFPNKNLVMITSAFPNEGKTFCTINLALMLSLEKNKSVLLVDADVLKPSVYKLLKFTNKLGLIDYLSGEVKEVEEVIYETSIPNLKILPAGTINSLSYELLASDRMRDLKEKLTEEYSDSIILFDGPPVLGVIETISLSQLAGQVLIISEHNKTKLSDIKDVVSTLHHNLFTGMIINKSVNNKLGQYGYGYGYYYNK